MAITVVRPAALVGEGVDTLVTRHFEAPRLLTVKGCAQRWQFCHIDDLVSALELAAAGEVSGELRRRLRRLAGAGAGRGAVRPAPDRAAGRPDLRHRAAAAPGRHHPGAGHRPALSSSTRGSSTASTLRDAGWRPASGNAAACRRPAGASGRRAPPSPGAAWPRRTRRSRRPAATVAVIGTAAIVRRAGAAAAGSDQAPPAPRRWRRLHAGGGQRGGAPGRVSAGRARSG